MFKNVPRDTIFEITTLYAISGKFFQRILLFQDSRICYILCKNNMEAVEISLDGFPTFGFRDINILNILSKKDLFRRQLQQ